MADKHNNATLEDVSQMRRPIQISGKPIEQVLNSVHYGSPELRCLLMDECHLIFECKVCRALFRDLPNFISHKRAYCTKSSLDDRHEAITELPEEKVVVVLPEAPEDHVVQGSSETMEPQVNPVSAIQRPKLPRMGLEDTIHRIQSGELGKSNGYKVYTEAAEKLQRQKDSMKVATIRTKEIPTNKNAVFIDVKMTSVSIHDRPNHEDISSRISEDKEKPEMINSAVTRKAGEKVGNAQSSQSSKVSPKGMVNKEHSQLEKLLMQQLKDLKRMKRKTILMNKDTGEPIKQNCALKNVKRPTDPNKCSRANVSGSTADISLKESASENVARANNTNDLRDLARQNFESLLAHAEENVGTKVPPDSLVNPDRAVVRRRFASNHSVKNSSFTDKAKMLVKSRSRSCKKSLSCSICNSVFSSGRSLQFHLKVHHSNTMTYYPCPYCASVFHYFLGVTRHLIRCHSKTTDEIDKMRKELREKAYTKTVSLLNEKNNACFDVSGARKSARSLKHSQATQVHCTTAKESLQSLRINSQSMKKETCITGVKGSRKDPAQSENPVENITKAMKKSQGTSISSRSKRFANRLSKGSVQDNVKQTAPRVSMDETEVGFVSVSSSSMVLSSKSKDNQDTLIKVCPGCKRSFGRKISFENHMKSCKVKEKHKNSSPISSSHYQMSPIAPNSSVTEKKGIITRDLNSPRTNTRQRVQETRHREGFQKTRVQNLHSNNVKITQFQGKEKLSKSPQLSATRLRRRHTINHRDLNRERMLSYRHSRSTSMERCNSNLKQRDSQTQRRVKSGLVSSSAVTLTSPVLTTKIPMEPKNFGSENVEVKQIESSDISKGVAKDENEQLHVDGNRNSSAGQEYGQRELITEDIPENKAVNKVHRRAELHEDTFMEKVDPAQHPEMSHNSNENVEKGSNGFKEDIKDVKVKPEIVATEISEAQNCVGTGELIEADKGKTCEHFVKDVKLQLDSNEECMDAGGSTTSGDGTSASKDLNVKNKQIDGVGEIIDRASHPHEGISGSCLNVRETDQCHSYVHGEAESREQKPTSSEVPAVVQALSERPKRKRKIPSRNLDAEEILLKTHSGDRDRRLAKRVKLSYEAPSGGVKKPSRDGLSTRSTNSELGNKNRRKLRMKDNRKDRNEIVRNLQRGYGGISKRMYVLNEQKSKGRNLSSFAQSEMDKLIDEKALCCRACGGQFTQMYSLQRHITQQHMKVSNPQLKLDMISEKTESEQKRKKKCIGVDNVRDEEKNKDRSRHMSNRLYVLDGRKPKGKKLVCYEQSKVDKLVGGKNLSCLECGEVFSQICNLRRHIIRCHLKWVRFRCKLCKFQCFDRSECSTHIIRVHKNTPRRGLIIDLAKQGAAARSQKKTQTLRMKQKVEGTAGNIYARPNVRQGLRLSQRVTNLNEGGTEKVKPETNCESDSSACHSTASCATQSRAVDGETNVAEVSKKSKLPQSQELVMLSSPMTTLTCSGEQTTRTYVVAGSSVSVFSEKSDVSVSSPSTLISSTSLDKHAASSSKQAAPISALLKIESQDKTTRKSMPFNISTRNSPRMFDIRPYSVENGVIHKKGEEDDKTIDKMAASTPCASGSDVTNVSVAQEAPIDRVQVIPESHESVIQSEPSVCDNSPKPRNIFDELRGEAFDTSTEECSKEGKQSASGSKMDHVPPVPKASSAQDEHKPYSIYKMIKTTQSHRHLPEPPEDHNSLVKSLLQLKKFGDENGLQAPTSVHSTTATTTVSQKSAIRQALCEPQVDLKRAPNPIERVVMVTARTLSPGKPNPAVTDVGSQPIPVKTSVSLPRSTVASGTVCTPPVVISQAQKGKVVFIAHHSPQQSDATAPPLSSAPCVSATIVKPPGSSALNVSSPQTPPSKTVAPNTFTAAAGPGKFVISKHYL